MIRGNVARDVRGVRTGLAGAASIHRWTTWGGRAHRPFADALDCCSCRSGDVAPRSHRHRLGSLWTTNGLRQTSAESSRPPWTCWFHWALGSARLARLSEARKWLPERTFFAFLPMLCRAGWVMTGPEHIIQPSSRFHEILAHHAEPAPLARPRCSPNAVGFHRFPQSLRRPMRSSRSRITSADSQKGNSRLWRLSPERHHRCVEPNGPLCGCDLPQPWISMARFFTSGTGIADI